jgi:hypothetical protein
MNAPEHARVRTNLALGRPVQMLLHFRPYPLVDFQPGSKTGHHLLVSDPGSPLRLSEEAISSLDNTSHNAYIHLPLG